MSDDGRVNFSLEVRGADGFNEVSRQLAGGRAARGVRSWPRLFGGEARPGE